MANNPWVKSAAPEATLRCTNFRPALQSKMAGVLPGRAARAYIAMQQQQDIQVLIMLQASLYAGRQETDCGSVSDSVLAKARRTLSGVGLGAVVAVARKAFAGEQSIPLSDHLLQDIGISRAELEALRF